MDGKHSTALIAELKRIADALESINLELDRGNGSYLACLPEIHEQLQNIACEQQHRRNHNA